MNIGIVGAEAAKFSEIGQARAREVIKAILTQGIEGQQAFDPSSMVLISGGCHLGGIDIWAEEEANKLGIPKIVHLPKHRNWLNGYKLRNLLIAQDSCVVHNIVVAQYPPVFHGMRFPFCYHCNDAEDHIKSGGCWTARRAMEMGKKAHWYIVNNLA